MKQEKLIQTTTYYYGAGFYIDIVVTYTDREGDNYLHEAWLYAKNFGIKTFMFGCYESTKDFLEMVEANAPEYINVFCNEYTEIINPLA